MPRATEPDLLNTIINKSSSSMFCRSFGKSSSHSMWPRTVAPVVLPKRQARIVTLLSLTSGMEFFWQNSLVPSSNYIAIQSLLTISKYYLVKKPFLVTLIHDLLSFIFHFLTLPHFSFIAFITTDILYICFFSWHLIHLFLFYLLLLM